MSGRGSRGWIWIQLLIGWLPVLALYAAMIVVMHGASVRYALPVAARAIGAAAALGVLVLRFTERLRWPHPFRVTFVLAHVVAALVYAIAWLFLTSAIEGLWGGRFLMGAPVLLAPFILLGIWLYIAVAGVSYAVRATERAARAEAVAARAEAVAARSQVAALRGQLNPHFLFNALHTVVQLIPMEPTRAAEAAERLASLLRTAIEEDRDLVPFSDERAFVERYLELERLRFGERLEVRFDIAVEATNALVPSFAVQTLVENAVRHGAGPKVEATRVTISAAADAGRLRITVADTGAGAEAAAVDSAPGTGLRRLRERLAVLHGSAGALTVATTVGGGFSVIITLPLDVSAAD